MDPFVAQLAELCRSNRTGVKWVFVPSHALGHTLGERLVRGGTSWANLRFTTPFDLALEMAAPFLVERRIAPAAGDVGPALVMRLLLDLPPNVPRYFRRLAEHPRMAEALWATLHELRMGGIAATDLGAARFVSDDKHTELVALLSTYEAHLSRHRLADRADVYREALDHLDLGPVLPEDIRLELPGVIWAPLEQRLLAALPGTRLPPRVLSLPGLERPRRLGDSGTLVLPVPTSDAGRLAYLLRPAEAPPPCADGSLAMFRAGGRESEVEEVLRRVLAGVVPLDHVEIACAQADAVVLFWEKAQRYQLPVTLGPGVPITLTRPGRALLAFCDWIERGLPAGALRRILQSGDVRLELDGGPTAGQAARLLARSAATWGRDTYAPALGAEAAAACARAADPEVDEESRARAAERAAWAGRLAGWIEALLGSIPDGATVRLGALLDACAAFVRESAARTSELDGAAIVVLLEALDSLTALGDLEGPPREGLALVRHQVDGLSVGGDRARPGHLFVTILRQAGYSGRPHTFVVGLEEGRVFPPLLEDPVLLDVEREALSPALPTSSDRASEALHAVVARLAALGERVCLSFSCRDLRGHRETFPSWLLLQALRLLSPPRQHGWTYQDLNEALGEPASAVPATAAQALAESGWWLAHLNGTGQGALPAVHAAFPWLAEGERAEEARESERFTVYDGHVPAAGARLDPRQSGRSVSATSLEDLARCPFRHFLVRGLGVEAVEDAEPDRDRWLDPLTRGSLLHDLYATMLREVRGRGERPDPQRHGDRLRALGEAKLAELRALIPPPSAYVFERERDEILNDLRVFLRLEARAARREPVGFEVSFGGGPTDGEPLAQPEPVTVELAPGLRFRLRGRIDRIDRLADRSYEVVDYKTGWYRAGEFAGTFRGGRLLQHALYGVVAAYLLARRDPQARVSTSSYYLPTVRGQGQRVTYGPVDGAALAAVIRDLFDVLAGGTFVHTASAEDCRWCEVGAACGREPFARSKEKIANPANRMLEPYRRLREHE